MADDDARTYEQRAEPAPDLVGLDRLVGTCFSIFSRRYVSVRLAKQFSTVELVDNEGRKTARLVLRSEHGRR